MSSRTDNRPLRFAFYRPHANIWFKPPVKSILNGQRLPSKYEPFFDHVLGSGAEVCFTTSLVRPNTAKELLKRLLEPFELLLWCVLNRLPLRRLRFVLSVKQLQGEDVLFMMHYANLTHENESMARQGLRLAEALAQVQVKKVVHMTHYAYCASVGASNLARMRPDLMVAENDLANSSSFFQRFFGCVPGRFQTLPYTPSARFKRTGRCEDRIHKAVATGTITYRMHDRDFIDFFGVDELQPLRRALFENADRLQGEIECLISDLNASRESARVEGPRSRFANLARRMSLRWGKHPQMNYYRRNIVEVYNSYTMFVVPEEICDLPAIGFIEGMACGCVYLGAHDPMYADIGMVSGVHYLGYDGTIEGLIDTVRDAQKDGGRERLSAIAETGRLFAIEAMNADRVYGRFMDDLRTARAPHGHG
jgi:hypothetical protein